MDVATLTTETVTVPVHVNVVPGDQAAGRVPNPTVRSELAFQTAQHAKRDAAEAMRSGDAAAGAADLERRRPGARGLRADGLPGDAPEIANEAELLRDLADRALDDDPSRMAKFSEEDRHYKERKRGRRRPPEQP